MLTNKIDKMIEEIDLTINELKEIEALNEMMYELDKRAMEKIAQYMK